MSNFEFGMIGLGTMGRSLLLNMADHGFSIAGYDLDEAKAKALQEAAAGKEAIGTSDLATFVSALRTPRAIMMLVPAGKPVDSVIASLLPHLSPGDVIIDGGNSYFKDTDRRYQELQAKGIEFVGMGVSGGEEGARRGPSMMPGGSGASFARIQPVLEAVAAKAQDGAPCVAHVGDGSAGHYVKMVHNGIEYAMMQLLAETYDILKRLNGMDNPALAAAFDAFNQSDIGGFLIEITSEVLRKKDDQSDDYLVDRILDQAKGKGTGKWTSQDAMDLAVPIPTIDAAVSARILSALKPERVKLASSLGEAFKSSGASLEVETVRQALGAAMLLSYAQGLSLIAEASKEYKFDVPMANVVRIWRAGCIIRSKFLPVLTQAYEADASLENPLMSGIVQAALGPNLAALRHFVQTAIQHGVPVPAFSASLAYIDGFTTSRLPANLVQAQRDLFGAHTFERIDQPGTFHANWSQA